MKYLVFSDIHGSAFYAKKIKELVNKENPDKVILLGDLYYHGPRNPLPQEHNPMEVCKIFNNTIHAKRSRRHKKYLLRQFFIYRKP